MGEQREMTLDEWVNRLPDFHLANKQYQQLQQRIAELEQELSEEKESHKTTYSLMKSGELRGVEKATEELQPKINELAATVERLRDVVVNYHDENIAAEEAMNELWDIHNATPQQNLNAIKREVLLGLLSTMTCSGCTFDMHVEHYTNQRYPVKDGER